MFRILMLIAAVSLFTHCTCKKTPKPENQEAQNPNDPNKAPDYSGITVPQVVKMDVAIGKGAEVKDQSIVTCKYGMWVYNPAAPNNKGKPIQASAEGSSFTFKIGKGEVIAGWEAGALGMKAGGKRSIIIPAAAAYGDAGNDKVPPKSIILVEMEVEKVE